MQQNIAVNLDLAPNLVEIKLSYSEREEPITIEWLREPTRKNKKLLKKLLTEINSKISDFEKFVTKTKVNDITVKDYFLDAMGVNKDKKSSKTIDDITKIAETDENVEKLLQKMFNTFEEVNTINDTLIYEKLNCRIVANETKDRAMDIIEAMYGTAGITDFIVRVEDGILEQDSIKKNNS